MLLDRKQFTLTLKLKPMKKIIFKNAFELANWIKSNIVNELKQEELMLKGIRNNYTLTNEDLLGLNCF